MGESATKGDTGILLDNLIILRARMDAHVAAVAEQGGGARCPPTPADLLLEALKEITDRAQAKDAAASGGSGGGATKPAYGSLANAPPLAMFAAAAAAGGDGGDGGAEADHALLCTCGYTTKY